ncbi:sigma-70 family RNA polymerase sigma factor [Candidatus Nomurabacteria bacterium]|nr:sigma-70 family RNA polymerase sigma factor [Candidatus Nomurabacteria bacterium]USN94757.1 MAG: sigma-70 family RNA polymerase sigma factor [Candidatus Nomurabacteria bacterium]
MEEDYTIQTFESIFEDYSDSIFRHFVFKISDRDRSKELTQEVFMRLWKTMSSGEAIDNPKSFLYKIAHNLYVNEYRDRKNHRSLEESMEQGFDVEGETEQDIFDNISTEEVIKLFEELKPSYREVLTMKLVDEYSVKEISEILGETENSVSVRLHRAIQKIKTILENHDI